MNIDHYTIRPLGLFATASIVMHMLLPSVLVLIFAKYDFTSPVKSAQPIMIETTMLRRDPTLAKVSGATKTVHTAFAEKTQDDSHQLVEDRVAGWSQSAQEHGRIKQESKNTEHLEKSHEATGTPASINYTDATLPAVPRDVSARISSAPVRMASEFLTKHSEKLTYQISLLGIPVGIAELEARNENGEVGIMLKIKSNAVISSIYPVDDSVETRHIHGTSILTRIRQHEGTFKSDIGVVLLLREKSVCWIDHLKNSSFKETVPTSDVLDTLSGFYYLRNRSLQVDTTEMLHIYDSETYADVPVEILRRETMRLLNLKEVNTLVLRPLQQTAGIFRRTGDILIWVTDDALKVPVKIVTSIALGKVTAELVSAETTPYEEVAKEK